MCVAKTEQCVAVRDDLFYKHRSKPVNLLECAGNFHLILCGQNRLCSLPIVYFAIYVHERQHASAVVFQASVKKDVAKHVIHRVATQQPSAGNH